MATTASDDAARRTAEREWWLRALAVLTAPRAVFTALRDDSDDDVEARQEPLTANVFLAAIALVLWTPATGRLLDDVEIDSLLVTVLVIFTAGIYAVFGYFVLGGALYLGGRAAGSLGDYRRARHVVGFALVPLALSLPLLWPIRLALWGGDSFRSGGADAGAPRYVLDACQAAFAFWTGFLLLVGVRAVHGWSWTRALGAVAAALAALAGSVAVVAAVS